MSTPAVIEESKIVQTHDFTSASAFLDALGRRQPYWKGEPINWVFRGHPDDNYELLPSASRNGARLGVGPNAPLGRAPTEWKQMEWEHELLWSFLIACDQSGLSVPHDSPRLHTHEGDKNLSYYISRLRTGTEFWPPTEFLAWIALAQHYGVATRLLDWSGTPLTACYFAALGAAKQQKQRPTQPGERYLSVWALNQAWVLAMWDAAFPGDGESYTLSRQESEEKFGHTLVRIVRAPRSSNANLHAQDGLFTLVHQMYADPGAAPHAKPLDRVIIDHARRFYKNPSPDSPVYTDFLPVMHRMRLDALHAPEMLRLISSERVDHSTMFPGYQGVAEFVKETEFWDRFP